jgi:2-methylisocitrate lyase-like PEP mutase family enzyme
VAEERARRAAFRALHERGCFVIPNPWDPGTAAYLQHLGFPALATSSAGFAFARGLPDDGRAVTRDMALGHIAEVVAATDLPVNADFQAGYADDPEGVARNVALCVATGVAGLSIEDATGDPARPLYDLPLAVERVRAARAAIDASASGVLLTARAECFMVGHPDPLPESIRRLQAYAAAGADVLYAPGPTRSEDLRAIVSAVAPKPVNVLMGGGAGLRTSDLAALGARRISVGSGLARTAWGAFARAARALADEGSFAGFEGALPYRELDALFAERWKGR